MRCPTSHINPYFSLEIRFLRRLYGRELDEDESTKPQTRKRFLEKVGREEEKLKEGGENVEVSRVVFTWEGLLEFQRQNLMLSLAQRDAGKRTQDQDGKQRRRPNYNNRKRRMLAKSVDRMKQLGSMILYLSVVTLRLTGAWSLNIV